MRLAALALATFGAALVSAPALATEAESAVYDIDEGEVIIAGTDLRDVDDVTLTSTTGKEASLAFSLTRERTPRIVAELPDDTPGTYRLRLYDDGALLDEMDVAVSSTAGAVSRDAIVQVTTAATCLTTKCSLVMRCPAGYVAIGGGFEKLTFNSALIMIDGSRPVAGGAWQVDYRKSNSSTYSIALRAYGTCLAQN